jgi:hypothetical protein
MKEIGTYKQAIIDAVEASNAVRIEADGETRHVYPDYDTYKKVQTAGNKAKLKKQFVKEPHIEAVSEYLNDLFGTCTFGLCHGTRGGLEQAWLHKHLKGSPEIIGTEISDTADQFDNTVQWDFHDVNPEWVHRADFVYSNSWYHVFDPEKAFSSWAEQLKVGGIMLLDYTKGQTPEEANALDPFGVTSDSLKKVLDASLSDKGSLIEVLDYRKSKHCRAQVFVWKREKM